VTDAQRESLGLIGRYIRERSPRVFKHPGKRFPHPFIDPGSIYDGNLWDWDTFWTVYALLAYARTAYAEPGFPEKLLAHARGNVENFLAFQLEDGYIPMMVSNNIQGDDEESYLIRKHREGHILNMHKPFLCQQAMLVSGLAGSHEWLRPHAGQFEAYFACYDRYYRNETTGLYVWADDVMIGMDNDPATFGRPRFSTANVFLNGFMVMEKRAMAGILKRLGDEGRAAHYEEKADSLAAAIQRECWDERDGFFYSQDVLVKTRAYDWFHKGLGVFWHTLPIKVRTWTGFIPMLAGVATPEQAERIVREHITDENTFASPYGIRALSKDEKMYNLDATNNPSNWLGPIWLVVNYAVFRALLNYGYRAQAERLFDQTVSLLANDLKTTGEMHEYYVPETGAPVMSPGFLNWNMLALNMAAELEGSFCAFDYLRA
jgi:putative isomerase